MFIFSQCLTVQHNIHVKCIMFQIVLSFYVEQEIEEISFEVNVTMVEETMEFLSVETCTS